MFHIYVTYKGKNYKIMIHWDNDVNIISKSTIAKMGLKAKLPVTIQYNLHW